MTDWPITFRCNNNCISCILDTHFYSRLQSDIPLKQIIDVIGSMKEKNNYLGVSGGEPTLRKEFFDILSYARKKHPDLYIFIVTNGRMFSYKSFTKKLADLDLGNYMVGVALYGHNREIHEKITRARNSFKQTVKGIKNLLSFNIPTEVRIIISKLNYKILPKISEFIVNNFKGVDRVVFINMKYTGNAFLNRNKIFVRVRDVAPYAEQATDILLESGFNTRLYHFPLCIIKRKYWDLAKGVTKDKRELCFAPQCKECIKKQDCPMIWKTYFELAGAEEFKPIKNSYHDGRDNYSKSSL